MSSETTRGDLGRRRGRGRTPDVGLPDDGADDSGLDATDRSVTEDDLFEVLANRRRRQVMAYLQAGDGTATAGELAEHIAAAENDTSVEQLSSIQRKRVYVSLYQNHLPVLDDANVAEYDHDRKTVALEVDSAALDHVVGEWSDPIGTWTTIAATVVLAAGVLLGALQVGAFAVAPAWAWIGIGLLGLFGLIGLDGDCRWLREHIDG